jgi:hypothetical protein
MSGSGAWDNLDFHSMTRDVLIGLLTNEPPLWGVAGYIERWWRSGRHSRSVSGPCRPGCLRLSAPVCWIGLIKTHVYREEEFMCIFVRIV